MKLLEDRILTDGRVLPGNILKVGSFLNQMIDPKLLFAMADEFFRLFGDCNVNKVLTIESSGIAIAIMTAQRFGCPMVFAKKHAGLNVDGESYKAVAHSYTHLNDYAAMVPVEYLNENDRVLIVDDFLANGEAMLALTEIVKQAGATTVGIGIEIEKSFQPGIKKLKQKGFRVESLARIEAFDDGKVVFKKD